MTETTPTQSEGEIVLTQDELRYAALVLGAETLGEFSVTAIIKFLQTLADADEYAMITPFLRTIEAVIVDARRYKNQEVYDATLGYKQDEMDSHE